MDAIRKEKCLRCSCNSAMTEIHNFNKREPKNDMEAMSLEEIITAEDMLWWELFQCYMDNNGTKCKGLYDFTKYLRENTNIASNLQKNLDVYKNKIRKNYWRLEKLRDLYSSYWYTTDWMSEREIWWIAYNRADGYIKLNKWK